MGTDPHDAPVVEDDDPVGVQDRAHTLSHDQHRRLGGVGSEGCTELGVGGRVQCGETVVEQVDRGPLHERPCDGQPLTLAAGDVRATLGNLRLQPSCHRGHELAGLGDCKCVPQLIVGSVGPAEAQVLGHGAAEQVGLLRDHADLRPERFARLVSHVYPVDSQGAARDVEQARDEVEQSRLARACAADDGCGLSWHKREGKIVQHRLLAPRVAEDHISHLHQTSCGLRDDSVLRVHDRRLGA